ncbi:hypothetical protein RF11_13587 [Thelohanellus kitauei]|uniref:Uncharacterized protein n=1 Tax=Thelohanellus kitauei TaxID=669202 RepID=A0A0C2JUH1_THEKT|nr:hypothetical protein RF11_13587 [Thelohanellus kitauei]
MRANILQLSVLHYPRISSANGCLSELILGRDSVECNITFWSIDYVGVVEKENVCEPSVVYDYAAAFNSQSNHPSRRYVGDEREGVFVGASSYERQKQTGPMTLDSSWTCNCLKSPRIQMTGQFDTLGHDSDDLHKLIHMPSSLDKASVIL